MDALKAKVVTKFPIQGRFVIHCLLKTTGIHLEILILGIYNTFFGGPSFAPHWFWNYLFFSLRRFINYSYILFKQVTWLIRRVTTLKLCMIHVRLHILPKDLKITYANDNKENICLSFCSEDKGLGQQSVKLCWLIFKIKVFNCMLLWNLLTWNLDLTRCRRCYFRFCSTCLFNFQARSNQIPHATEVNMTRPS